MNKMQQTGVVTILKKRFPNLPVHEAVGLSFDIVEVVLNQATPSQFPNWKFIADLKENEHA